MTELYLNPCNNEVCYKGAQGCCFFAILGRALGPFRLGKVAR